MPYRIAFFVIFACAALRAEPVVTVGTLEGRLTGTPLAGRGPVFLGHGAKYGADPRLVVAIAGGESTFGKHICADNNAWNWFWGGTCEASPFVSWDRGIEVVSKFLNKSYLLKGYETIEQIGGKYCAEGCEHWVPNVETFYTSMGGDTADLTYAHPAGPLPEPPRPKPAPPKPQPPEPKPEPPVQPVAPEQGLPWWAYLLIGVAGLMLIGAIVTAILIARRAGAGAGTANARLTLQPSLAQAGTPIRISASLDAGARKNLETVTLIRVEEGAPAAILGQMALGRPGVFELEVVLSAAQPGTISLEALMKVRENNESRTISSDVAEVTVLPADFSFDLPPGWRMEKPEPGSASGSLRLCNAAAGSTVPLSRGGAVVVAESRPIPATAPIEAVRQEIGSAGSVSILETFAGIKANFTTKADGNMEYSNTALYVTHGDKLFRFLLTRRAGDPAESQMLAQFQGLLDSVRFPEVNRRAS